MEMGKVRHDIVYKNAEKAISRKFLNKSAQMLQSVIKMNLTIDRQAIPKKKTKRN